MAFEVKEVNYKVAGVATVKLLGINPTVAEAAKFGINLKEDTKLDKEKMRLTLWLEVIDKGFECKTAMSIFLSNKIKGSDGAGGFETFIDETGANGQEQYVKGSKVRKAREGEDQLANLIMALTNGGKVAKEDLDLVFKGDLTPLKELVIAAKDNMFKVALGIRFGEYNGNVTSYMDVYPYKFGKAVNTGFKTKFAEEAAKKAEKTWFKDRWYPATFELTRYMGQTLADKTVVAPQMIDGDVIAPDDLFAPREDDASF